MTDENKKMALAELTTCRETITKKIPEEHLQHTFWCPKDKDGDNERPGLYLYAYGGCVLKLYLIKPKKKEVLEIHFSLFDVNYEKKYFVDKKGESTWTDEARNKYMEVRKTNGSSTERLERLLGMGTSEWDIILNAFKTRAYAGIDEKKYLERARETVIAHINNGDLDDGIKIIEMESRINLDDGNKIIEMESRIKRVAKPDLIGVRKEGNENILSFIEYKCTSGAMDGKQRPIDHYEDMKRLLEPVYEFECYWGYDKRIGIPVLQDGHEVKREIILLFSNVGENDPKKGMTVKKAINGINKVKEQAAIDKCGERVKVVILKDENEIIKKSSIISMEEAVDELKNLLGK